MKNESGYAVIESFLIGLVLIVPLIWVSIAASSLHRAALASSSAVREAGLVASRAVNAPDADRGARSAVTRALSEQGVDPAISRVFVTWSSTRDVPVGVEVEIPVQVLAIPFVGRPVGPAIWVKARHVAQVEPYRSLDE